MSMSERQRDDIVNLVFLMTIAMTHLFISSSLRLLKNEMMMISMRKEEDKRAVSADPSYHADYCSGDT